MKFSFATIVAALAAGAVAHGADAEEYTTVVVTEYTTYCPQSTALTIGTETIPVPTPGTVTLSNGPYTVTRPLITSTITRCKACTTPTPSVSIPVIPVQPPVESSIVIPSSKPVIPTSVAPTEYPSGSGTTPAAPAFTGGASRAAAGAGAGLAAVFGAVAYLL